MIFSHFWNHEFLYLNEMPIFQIHDFIKVWVCAYYFSQFILIDCNKAHWSLALIAKCLHVLWYFLDILCFFSSHDAFIFACINYMKWRFFWDIENFLVKIICNMRKYFCRILEMINDLMVRLFYLLMPLL